MLTRRNLEKEAEVLHSEIPNSLFGRRPADLGCAIAVDNADHWSALQCWNWC